MMEENPVTLQTDVISPEGDMLGAKSMIDTSEKPGSTESDLVISPEGDMLGAKSMIDTSEKPGSTESDLVISPEGDMLGAKSMIDTSEKPVSTESDLVISPEGDMLGAKSMIDTSEKPVSTESDLVISPEGDMLGAKSMIDTSEMPVSTESDLDASQTTENCENSIKLDRPENHLKIIPINPAFLKPFELGWKRELVYRNQSADRRKRVDIYYIDPSGKKHRSSTSVSEYIEGSSELTMANFLFKNYPVGVDDPGKEVIRSAKLISSRGSSVMKNGSVSSVFCGTPRKVMKRVDEHIEGSELIKAIFLSKNSPVGVYNPDKEVEQSAKPSSSGGSLVKKERNPKFLYRQTPRVILKNGYSETEYIDVPGIDVSELDENCSWLPPKWREPQL